MLGYLILCFVAVAVAAPQYNYQPAEGGFGQASGASYQAQGIRQAPSIYNKQFFIHSAPEDEALDSSGSNNDNTLLKRNLRVVIVKAPENKGLTNAALQLAKTASEDKTVVYVLNKQTDLAELQAQLAQIQDNSASKPEVHFVKYKTPEEADHAQHAIQSQYDSLGGSTQVSDEGVASLENFIGSLGNTGSISGSGSSHGTHFTGSVPNTYIPPVQAVVTNTYLPPAKLY